MAVIAVGLLRALDSFTVSALVRAGPLDLPFPELRLLQAFSQMVA
jgi:hypothetical protein